MAINILIILIDLTPYTIQRGQGNQYNNYIDDITPSNILYLLMETIKRYKKLFSFLIIYKNV